jgi:hypothetical protein
MPTVQTILAISGRNVKTNGKVHQESVEKLTEFINRSSNLRPYRLALFDDLKDYVRGECTPVIEMVIKYRNDEFPFSMFEPMLVSMLQSKYNSLTQAMKQHHISISTPSGLSTSSMNKDLEGEITRKKDLARYILQKYELKHDELTKKIEQSRKTEKERKLEIKHLQEQIKRLEYSNKDEASRRHRYQSELEDNDSDMNTEKQRLDREIEELSTRRRAESGFP